MHKATEGIQRGARFAAVALVVGASTPAANGEPLPLWEIGAGATAFYLPDYRGADEGRAYLLPFPYFIYRGDRLRADREGARAELFETDRVELTLSASGGVPVRTGSNAARAGMRALRPVIEFGPALNLTLARSGDRRADLRLRLPVRGALTIESSPDSIGGTFAPFLQLRMFDAPWAGGATVRAGIGAAFSSRAYHRYYYGVTRAEATPARRAYEPAGGFSGWQAGLNFSHESGRWRYFGFCAADVLRGTAFDDSPLLKRRTSVIAGGGLAYVLTQSKRNVQRED
jgi:outer membrane scaffolding protein for murein synthesis (MipA/OmpV family)